MLLLTENAVHVQVGTVGDSQAFPHCEVPAKVNIVRRIPRGRRFAIADDRLYVDLKSSGGTHATNDPQKRGPKVGGRKSVAVEVAVPRQ